MPTFTLPTHEDTSIEFYTVPSGTHVRIKIESEHPIRAYIVDDDGLAEFEAGDEFTVLAGDRHLASKRTLSAFVPRDVAWFLLLMNESAGPIAVHWEWA